GVLATSVTSVTEQKAFAQGLSGNSGASGGTGGFGVSGAGPQPCGGKLPCKGAEGSGSLGTTIASGTGAGSSGSDGRTISTGTGTGVQEASALRSLPVQEQVAMVLEREALLE